MSEKLTFLNMEQVKYSSHVKNIERDNTKQLKYNTTKKPSKKPNGRVKLGRF